jgi:hypothetical protein
MPASASDASARVTQSSAIRRDASRP